MSEAVAIGLVSRGDGVLGRAAQGMPRLEVHPIEDAPDRIDGLIVDAPPRQRAQVLAQLRQTWRVPILIEAPVAFGEPDADVVVANPLRYGLHTRRLLEAVRAGADEAETFFAAWRFKVGAVPETALPLLVDFVRALCPDEIARVTVLERNDPWLLLATLRFASGALGNLEIGGHLPLGYPAPSEFVAEWFSNQRAFSCMPGNQSVALFGAAPAAHDWQPDPASAVVDAFADWLAGGPRPPGSIVDDQRARDLVEQLRSAGVRATPT
jgi:hypothetical protein